ncbi:prepilin-type N-terminal cleavage/methylation domain-containing protein [Deinococcus wulumuqiensis]|uniref:prepilin-type N-terminal cleavage/methylation domain-containing protein n=1 Tax=Deinococcus wulumuqiensis TaxID=980427 RepID=UPI00242CE181|nr:prepilin-type N-terminal cleavage/methylation domain-containing protein [Deinococcus wulumuqiensis]
MKREAQRGLTLVELLVALALMGIVLTALVNYFSQGSRVATESGSRAELQQEILNAQQLIAGRLKEAWYVYPAGQTLQLGASATSTASLRRNPIPNTARTGTANWLTGSDPVLAMILPPRAAGTCPTTAPSGGGSADLCYRFFAYYPVKRSVWVSGTGGTSAPSASNPGDEPANDNVWVLAEYRKTLYGFTPATAVPTTTLDGGDANLLTDYVAPTYATPGFTTSSNTYSMFTLMSANGAVTSSTNPVSGVTLNLATTRNTGGNVLRLPGQTGTYSITIYPANLGKIASN